MKQEDKVHLRDMGHIVNFVETLVDATQHSVQRTATLEPVCTCRVTVESYNNCEAHGARRR